MNFDVHTLAAVLSLTYLLQVVALFAQYLTNKNQRGLGLWTLGNAMLALGFLLNYLRDNPVIGLIAIVLNNVFILTGLLILYAGILRFLDRLVNYWKIITFFIVFTILIIYFTYVNNNMMIRMLILSIAFTVISLLISLVLFIHKTGFIKTSAYFLAAVFLANSGFFAVRALPGINSSTFNLFSPSLILTASYLDGIILCTLSTFGFIIMINQRLNTENREDKENLEVIFSTYPDTVTITRITDGLYIRINEGFSTMMGFTLKN